LEWATGMAGALPTNRRKTQPAAKVRGEWKQLSGSTKRTGMDSGRQSPDRSSGNRSDAGYSRDLPDDRTHQRNLRSGAIQKERYRLVAAAECGTVRALCQAALPPQRDL